jgi:hypothetical protein
MIRTVPRVAGKQSAYVHGGSDDLTTRRVAADGRFAVLWWRPDGPDDREFCARGEAMSEEILRKLCLQVRN